MLIYTTILFFKESNDFLQQRFFKLLKSESKNMYNVTEDLKMLFFWTFYSSKNPENNFTIDEMFLEYQISILEWFLKDHMTLKTGVMADGFAITKINYILKF